jgi:diguanylate cyclase (GGDEF)-like protein
MAAGRPLRARLRHAAALRPGCHRRGLRRPRDHLRRGARRSFDAALHRALRRPDGAALILFDFDEFKAINDEHGHPVGDAVLRAVAAACDAVVREGDCLARIGGDEFAVVAAGAGATGVARIVSSLEEAISVAEVPPGIAAVRASFAWAVAPDDATSAPELLDRADQRLLYRKRLSKSAF